jgi:hypothetical protein
MESTPEEGQATHVTAGEALGAQPLHVVFGAFAALCRHGEDGAHKCRFESVSRQDPTNFGGPHCQVAWDANFRCRVQS